ncbi:glycosyltransferase [Micromonospora sp. B11E3]|uniref:glycosyltransferase family 2 protein n=1 Tax=Micromonospora sp. B11E3 TaxID=3153562 RepID=UPI00325E2390
MRVRPLVSVIVPNYNYAPSLPLCLRALLNQTYHPVEIIVVDDCSTDDSVDVAHALGVRVIRRTENGGCAAARNTGAAEARGEILFLVDSDVMVAPDAIEKAVAILESDPRVGAVCGIADPVPLIRDSLLEEYRALQFHHWSASSEGDVSFLFPAMCAIPAKVFAEIGEFNARLKQTEEVDYGYRLSQRYRLLLTSAVRGRHDHDHDLRTLLRKLFHRGRARIPLYARVRRFAKGFETGSRAWGSLAALGAVVAAGLPLLLGPAWTVLPVGLLAASVAADAGMYRFVLSRRGPAFLAYFTAVHFLVNVTIAVAAGTGVLQWLLSDRFRRLYDTTPLASREPAV